MTIAVLSDGGEEGGNTYSFWASMMMSTESLVLATVGGAPMSSLKVGTDMFAVSD